MKEIEYKDIKKHSRILVVDQTTKKEFETSVVFKNGEWMLFRSVGANRIYFELPDDFDSSNFKYFTNEN